MKIPEESIKIFFEMEERYRSRDVEYFRGLLHHPDMVVRARAACILAELGGYESINDLADVLLNDPHPIVRHEAAYGLGQLGYREAIPYLVQSLREDPHPIVRHEAAIALGVIGREDCVEDLEKALQDQYAEVVDSAVIALSNIEFCKRLYTVSRDEAVKEFARKTGG